MGNADNNLLEVGDENDNDNFLLGLRKVFVVVWIMIMVVMMMLEMPCTRQTPEGPAGCPASWKPQLT